MISNLFQHKTPQGITYRYIKSKNGGTLAAAALHISIPSIQFLLGFWQSRCPRRRRWRRQKKTHFGKSLLLGIFLGQAENIVVVHCCAQCSKFFPKPNSNCSRKMPSDVDVHERIDLKKCSAVIAVELLIRKWSCSSPLLFLKKIDYHSIY